MTNILDLVGRVFISLVFLLSGINKIGNYEGTIEGGEFTDSKGNDIQFKIGTPELAEFHDCLLGMSPGAEKVEQIELPERFGENEGKKATFKIQLVQISIVKRPKLDSILKNIYIYIYIYIYIKQILASIGAILAPYW